MNPLRRTLAWLKLRERPLLAGIAVLGFLTGVLSTGVALVQAALLYSQRVTPYETAVYVRQLEVSENFAGAAHEQYLRMINLHNDCVYRVRGDLGTPQDYMSLAQEFRTGSQALHIAYGATLASFPTDVHDRAQRILGLNEHLFDEIVAPAADCNVFLDFYDRNQGSETARSLYDLTGEMVNSLRHDMRIEELSWPAPVREAARERSAADGGAKP